MQELVFLNRLCRKNSKNLAHDVARYVMRAAAPEDDATLLIKWHRNSQEWAQTRPRHGDWRGRKGSPGVLYIMPQKRPFFSSQMILRPGSRLRGCESSEKSIEGRIEAESAVETEAWERSGEGLLPAPTLTKAEIACFHCTHVLCRKNSRNLAREMAQSIGGEAPRRRISRPCRMARALPDVGVRPAPPWSIVGGRRARSALSLYYATKAVVF
jgi:hypothetical protein